MEVWFEIDKAVGVPWYFVYMIVQVYVARKLSMIIVSETFHLTNLQELHKTFQNHLIKF